MRLSLKVNSIMYWHFLCVILFVDLLAYASLNYILLSYWYTIKIFCMYIFSLDVRNWRIYFWRINVYQFLQHWWYLLICCSTFFTIVYLCLETFDEWSIYHRVVDSTHQFCLWSCPNIHPFYPQCPSWVGFRFLEFKKYIWMEFEMI